MTKVSKKHFWTGAKPVGAFVPKVARAAFEAKGFPSAAIVTDWPAIAGEEFAAFTAPERLVWPRQPHQAVSGRGGSTGPGSRRPVGATLMLRVDGPRALEIQYTSAQLIDRINSYFGYRAIASIRIIQGPVHEPDHAPEPLPAPAPAKETPELARIEDTRLRDALTRLRSRVG